MNQISIFESSKITAFGIFSVNLNLVISVSMKFSNCVIICSFFICFYIYMIRKLYIDKKNVIYFCLQILILLVTGVVTIIQMQKNPVMLLLNENGMKFLNNMTKVK